MTDGGQLHLSPGEVADALGVSGSTFRRISGDYEGVFSPLPRDAQNRRLWPIEAAQRVQVAHAAVKEGRADSTRAALEALRDGRDLPTRADLPPAPDAGRALAQLDDLTAQVKAQGQGITELLKALDSRDAEIAEALRALAAAQQSQTAAIQALQAQVQGSARPAPAPPSAPRRGVLARLLAALLAR